MGEIADDGATGLMCSGCGTYFEKPHGYPVLCRSCWTDTPPQARAGCQRAVNKEL